MQYSISDFLKSHDRSVRLVAGQGGLARAVNEVGILDYELVPGLKSRYQKTNFYEGQLVLSTFLYARDSPYLITDAMRYLVSVGASGLVIKNVFHLELPEAALRLANARNLPVMIVADEALYFDQIVLEVGLRVRELEEASYAQRELDVLLRDPFDAGVSRERALRLNPSFGEEHVALYLQNDDPYAASLELPPADGAQAFGVRDLLCTFDGGLLAVVSGDTVTQAQVDAAEAVLAGLGLKGGIGLSELHQGIDELGLAVLEAVHAARLAVRRGRTRLRYEDLGVLRAVLPHATSPSMRAFSQAVLGPLHDFDTEHGAQVARTLETYLDCGRSVDVAAERLGTHPNTVRYRLGQLAVLCSLDWRNPEHMEQLALAHAIAVAGEVSWK